MRACKRAFLCRTVVYYGYDPGDWWLSLTPRRHCLTFLRHCVMRWAPDCRNRHNSYMELPLTVFSSCAHDVCFADVLNVSEAAETHRCRKAGSSTVIGL